MILRRSEIPDSEPGMGTTATAVVLEGPEIHLYGRIITPEVERGWATVYRTALGLPIAQCVLLGFWHSSREDMLAHENAVVFIH
eukprot:1183022-Prorocentrum_minimum.AAC.5